MLERVFLPVYNHHSFGSTLLNMGQHQAAVPRVSRWFPGFHCALNDDTRQPHWLTMYIVGIYMRFWHDMVSMQQEQAQALLHFTAELAAVPTRESTQEVQPQIEPCQQYGSVEGWLDCVRP